MSISLHPRSLRRKAARARRRAFTLVELAIVVVIVGVLAVIAVVGYRKLTATAKMTEAATTISAIRLAQEEYRTDGLSIYADIGGATYCPDAASGTAQVKWAWNPACSGGGTSPTQRWQDLSALKLTGAGTFQFGYMTVAGPGGSSMPASMGWVNTAAVDLTIPWYVIIAEADLDGRGGNKTMVVGASFSKTNFVRFEGE